MHLPDMAKVISVNKILSFSKNQQKSGKIIVLAGGCFDVLHPGHVIFLERAKQTGDCLVVLLESDEKVKYLKGINRPVHNQAERAKVLSALRAVDYVVLLSSMESDSAYDALVQKIKPDVIAVTYGEANQHQKRAAKLTGAKLKFVTRQIGNYSTSRILNH